MCTRNTATSRYYACSIYDTRACGSASSLTVCTGNTASLPLTRVCCGLVFGVCSLKVEAAWAARSAAAPPRSQALLVPLCCDWNGLNDQLALGTQVHVCVSGGL